MLVKKLNSDILLDRIRKNPNASRPASITKDNIIKRLGGDEDDVQMDACKISLVDPVIFRNRLNFSVKLFSLVECALKFHLVQLIAHIYRPLTSTIIL